MISARTVLECETKRLLKRVTNSVRQRVSGFAEDEASDLAVAQLWTIRQLLNPTDSAESAAERPGPATPPAGSGQPDLRSAPENSHSGDGADRILPNIGHQLAALIDGYLAEATPDHRQQITNLLGALRLSISLAYDLAGQVLDAKTELALMDDGMAAVHDRLDRDFGIDLLILDGVPERLPAIGEAERSYYWQRSGYRRITYTWRHDSWAWSDDGATWNPTPLIEPILAMPGEHWVRVDNPWPATDTHPLASLLTEAVDCIDVVLTLLDMAATSTGLAGLKTVADYGELVDRLRAAAAQINDTPN